MTQDVNKWEEKEFKQYQDWCYSVLRLDTEDITIRNTFDYWQDKFTQTRQEIAREVEVITPLYNGYSPEAEKYFDLGCKMFREYAISKILNK